MICSLTDLDQTCDIVTAKPERRMGPMRLRAAIRSIAVHRPLAETVTIELRDGTRLDELEIEALHTIASGTLFGEQAVSRHVATKHDQASSVVVLARGL